MLHLLIRLVRILDQLVYVSDRVGVVSDADYHPDARDDLFLGVIIPGIKIAEADRTQRLKRPIEGHEVQATRVLL